MDLVEIVGAYEKCEGMDPGLLLTLILRLPDTSMLTATLHDKDDWQIFLGWGIDRQIAAAQHDMTVLVARAAGNWAKKPPEIPTWERPWEAKRKQEKKPTSIWDIQKMFAAGTGARRL